jgi:hypothetical protein
MGGAQHGRMTSTTADPPATTTRPPVSARLRLDGLTVVLPCHDEEPNVAGRFEVALQDDLGFVKLVRRFTGARVSLSTLSTSAGHVPVSPPLTAGAGYRAASFTATAFPSGALRVVLAVPSANQSGG